MNSPLVENICGKQLWYGHGWNMKITSEHMLVKIGVKSEQLISKTYICDFVYKCSILHTIFELSNVCFFIFLTWLLCFLWSSIGNPNQLWRVWPGDSLWYSDYRRWRGGGRSYNYTTSVSLTLSITQCLNVYISLYFIVYLKIRGSNSHTASCLSWSTWAVLVVTQNSVVTVGTNKFPKAVQYDQYGIQLALNHAYFFIFFSIQFSPNQLYLYCAKS